jgi:predicted O-methyltransferase YrrM
MSDPLFTSVHFVCETVENERLAAENTKRQSGTIYEGDTFTGSMCIWRTNDYPDSKGPWLVDVGWPHKFKFAPDSSGIDEGSAALLHGLVRALRPKIVFETGTHKARSTHAIASAMVQNAVEVFYKHDARLYTVDMDDYGVIADALTQDELLITTQIIGKCPEILSAEPLAGLQNIDMAFLDGAHDAATLIKEMEFVDARRSPVCTVLVDNAIDSGWPEIRAYFNQYMLYPHIPLTTMSGLEIIQMRGEKRRHGEEKKDG